MAARALTVVDKALRQGWRAAGGGAVVVDVWMDGDMDGDAGEAVQRCCMSLNRMGASCIRSM